MLDRSDLDRMMFNNVHYLITKYGDTDQYPEVVRVQEALIANGLDRDKVLKKVTTNSWIYKYCALMWEASYGELIEDNKASKDLTNKV